jgi:arylformamidase
MSDAALWNAWRELAPAALVREYDNRSAVPEHPAIFRRWAEDSESWRRTASNPRLGLGYGHDRRQRIDLFLPPIDAAANPPPLLVYLHGGSWQSLGRRDFSFIAEGPMLKGFAVAVAGYRLCPSVGLADVVEDARRACLFLWQQGRRLGYERERMVVAGHSAGAHLAAMLLATRWERYGRRHPSGLVSAAIGLSGLYQLEPLLGTPVNRALDMDAKLARAQSPVYLEPPISAPFLLAVGELESREYHRQSELLADIWPARGIAVDLLCLPGHNHFSIVDELARPRGLLTTLLPALLEASCNGPLPTPPRSV